MSEALKIVAIAVPCLIAFRFALALDGSRSSATIPYRRVRHFVRVLAVGFVATQFLQMMQPRLEGGFLLHTLVVIAAMYGTHRLALFLDRALVEEASAASGRRAG